MALRKFSEDPRLRPFLSSHFDCQGYVNAVVKEERSETCFAEMNKCIEEVNEEIKGIHMLFRPVGVAFNNVVRRVHICSPRGADVWYAGRGPTLREIFEFIGEKSASSQRNGQTEERGRSLRMCFSPKVLICRL
jgi:hypothetical protein